MLKVNSCASWMMYWKLQASLSHQLASNCHATKPWFSSTIDFWFLTMCLHSSVYTSFMIFNLKPLSRKSCLISLTIIICQKFASSCQNSCQNLPHMRLTPVYMKKNLARHISNMTNDLFNISPAKSPKIGLKNDPFGKKRFSCSAPFVKFQPSATRIFPMLIFCYFSAFC